MENKNDPAPSRGDEVDLVNVLETVPPVPSTGTAAPSSKVIHPVVSEAALKFVMKFIPEPPPPMSPSIIASSKVLFIEFAST